MSFPSSPPSFIESVLTFWFGPTDSADYGQYRPHWFQSSLDFDKEIRQKFEPLYLRAAKGEFSDLTNSPQGCLGLVILLDQFPRNMYRGTARSFATDTLALNVAKKALEQQFDEQFLPAERLFLYLPFEHSEHLEDQERSLCLFKALGDAQALDYAQQHYDLIKRFGRFPHRNAILGRPSTSEELAFLSTPNAPDFGTQSKKE